MIINPPDFSGGVPIMIPGLPRAILFENAAGTAVQTDARLIAEGLDPAGNPTVQDSRMNGPVGPRWRLGAWTAEGDTENRPATGLEVYSQQVDAPFPFDVSNGSKVRLSSIALTFTQLLAGAPVVRAELDVIDGLRLRNDAGALKVHIDRAGQARIEKTRFGAAGPTDEPGNGSPETVIVADRGSTFRRRDGGPGTTLYIKEAGDGLATGWTPVASGGGGVPAGPGFGLLFYNQSGAIVTPADPALRAGYKADPGGQYEDPFGRPLLWDLRNGTAGIGAVVYLGSWTTDGDPTDQRHQGIRCIDRNYQGALGGGLGGYTRVKGARFAIAQITAGTGGSLVDFWRANAQAGSVPSVETKNEAGALTSQLRMLTGEAWQVGLRFGGPSESRAAGGTTVPERGIAATPGDLYFQRGAAPQLKLRNPGTNDGWGGFDTCPGNPAEGLYVLGAIPAIGDQFTINDPRIAGPPLVLYEWNAANPPVMGTPGAVWLYCGATLLEAQTIFWLAMNGAADPRIAYNGILIPLVSTMPVGSIPAVNTLDVYSSYMPGGGNPAPRNGAGEALTFGAPVATTPANFWMQASSKGEFPSLVKRQNFTHVLTTQEAAAGFFLVHSLFTCTGAVVTPGQLGAGPFVQAYTWGAKVSWTGGAFAGQVYYLTLWG